MMVFLSGMCKNYYRRLSIPIKTMSSYWIFDGLHKKIFSHQILLSINSMATIRVQCKLANSGDQLKFFEGIFHICHFQDLCQRLEVEKEKGVDNLVYHVDVLPQRSHDIMKAYSY